MWISKKKWNGIKKEIAALKERQLLTEKNIKDNTQSNIELIKIVKQLRSDLESLETFDTDVAE